MADSIPRWLPSDLSHTHSKGSIEICIGLYKRELFTTNVIATTKLIALNVLDLTLSLVNMFEAHTGFSLKIVINSLIAQSL